jgi:predicted nucleotidyltransferase
MEQHHQATIDRLTETFHDDPRYIALIIGGSVAKGLARPDSDVDFILVAAQEVMSKATRPDELYYFDQEIAAYDGGYVDGKIYDLPFLRELAEHGSEVARSAFIMGHEIPSSSLVRQPASAFRLFCATLFG